MKKTLIIATLLLIIGHAGFSQVKFGLGAVVGTKSGWEIDESAPVSADLVTNLKLNYGINARVLWEFNDKISFVGGLTYFLPTKITSDDQEINYYNMVVSANAHYNILKKDKIQNHKGLVNTCTLSCGFHIGPFPANNCSLLLNKI